MLVTILLCWCQNVCVGDIFVIAAQRFFQVNVLCTHPKISKWIDGHLRFINFRLILGVGHFKFNDLESKKFPICSLGLYSQDGPMLSKWAYAELTLICLKCMT